LEFPAQLDEGVREGWITLDERKQLEELREMTLDTIMVDDFESWELRSAGYVERDETQPKAHRAAA
jgi:acyl-CoA dehydrogenase